MLVDRLLFFSLRLQLLEKVLRYAGDIVLVKVGRILAAVADKRLHVLNLNIIVNLY